MTSTPLFRRRLSKVDRIGGFTRKAVGPNECGMMIHTAFCHSGEEMFHRLAPQYWAIYCSDGSPSPFPPELVADYLAVIHSDESADVFAGNIPVQLGFRAKRLIAANAIFPVTDLADITHQTFVDINIEPSDSLVYCFRVGWRYGLFFDFGPSLGSPRSNTEELNLALGNAHRFLIFFDDYTAHERSSSTGLLDDGWFPFIHLLGGEYCRLADLYSDSDSKRFVNEFIDKFNAERVGTMTEGWWSNALYDAKKEILLSGIDAFCLGTQRGAIACLKVLYSEIEGLVRIACCREKNVAKPSFGDLLAFVSEKGQANFDTNSLAFPDAFYRYLRHQVFAGFDLLSGDIPISRHSSSHGVADVATYSRARALQAILTLDQLFFYLPG